jgi:preprotein translocase subunit SecG
MEAVLITVYLIIVLALIAVILLQRSEGGGLGMGSSNAGVMTVRGSANLLTRTTAVLATLFMATAIGLTILTEINRPAQSILQRAADSVGEGADAPTTVLDALNALQGDDALNIPVVEGGASDVGAGATNPASDPALNIPELADPAAGQPGTVEAQPSTSAPAADQPAAEGGTPASGETAPAAPVN